MTECKKLMYLYVCDVDECPNESVMMETTADAEHQAILDHWVWVHVHEDCYYHLCPECATK